MSKNNMTKKDKTKQSVHDTAIRLLEGGIVEIDGLCFSMDEVKEDHEACWVCDLDSICSQHIIDVCVEADMITNTRHKMILR